LASKDVGQVNLDNRQRGRRKSVEHRDRGMGQRPGIENDSVRRFARLLDPIDELAFVIALPKIDLEIERRGAGQAARLDIGQRVMTVDRRVTYPEQVQIGAVQDKDDRQASPPSDHLLIPRDGWIRPALQATGTRLPW